MHRIIGRLDLRLRDPSGRTLACRRATNTVMRGGAGLIADLFRGAATTAINGMAVGIGSEPPVPPFDSDALVTSNPDATPAILRFAIPIAPEAMTVEVIERDFKVRLRVRGLLPAEFAQDPAGNSVEFGEAGLGVLAPDGLSLARLYNRVVFEPIRKEKDQEIALYWDVDFPYGS